MSTEGNKAIARRFAEEVWGKGNLDVVDELLATNFVNHDPSPGMTPDREGFRKMVSMFQTAFPDFHLTLEDMVAEGDKVVVRWNWGGTHKGEYMGIAPTGKQVTLKGVSIHRFEGGKVVEQWHEVDMLGQLQQLGVVPPMGKGGG